MIRRTGRASGLPKYAQVAASVRAQIKDGGLLPGASAPSGAALARATGFSVLTCRRGLETLIKDGVLVPGPSRNARPRVPGPALAHGEQSLTEAERVLSMTLGARRRAVGITQPQLAAIVGVSITTIGHAETGRLWQSRDFWERADKALDAGGLLLHLHDDYRAAAVPAGFDSEAEAEYSPAEGPPAADPDPDPGTVTCITITWGDGTTTIVHPPASTGACHVEISEIHRTSRDGTSRP
jgi:hypothetical protein